MTRTHLVVALSCSLFGCDKSEERMTALESRITAIESKHGETDASLGKLSEEQKALDAKLVALQVADAQKTETLASLQKELADVQEQIAMLAKPGTMSVEPGTAAKTGSGEIGIPACDEYITKYIKCIEDKMPASSRKQMNEAMALSIDAWKEAARGPGRDGLAEGCKAALEAAKTATAAMGCEW